MNTYKIAGLNVSSEFEMNAPVLDLAGSKPDVVIKFVDAVGTPDHPTLDDIYIKGNSQDLWFMGHESLEFRVRNGKEIQIWADKECSSADINLFLIGSGFGVLAFQRGLVPLHISAVEHNGRTLAVTGESGAGKSTLATALSKLGYAHFCDDVGIFDPNITPFVVRAMPKGIKLWDEAAAELNIEQGPRVSNIPDLLKTYIEPPVRSNADTLSLDSLYVISETPADKFAITELVGMEKFVELRRAIYREEWFEAFFTQKQAFELVAQLAKSIQVFKFDRPRDLGSVAESAEFLRDFFESHIG
jgi:hypothetical protein